MYIIIFCTNAFATEDFFKDAKNLFDQVKELKDKFVKICNTLCSKIDSIEDRLKDMEAKNES